MSDRVAIFFWAGSALFGAILTGELYSSGDLDVQPAATVPASEATRAVQHKQNPPVDDLIATSMDRPLFSATRRPTERAVPNRTTSSLCSARTCARCACGSRPSSSRLRRLALWVCWPKKASGVPTDLGERGVREHGLGVGLVDVKVAAIDQTWSGLKFVRRLSNR